MQADQAITTTAEHREDLLSTVEAITLTAVDLADSLSDHPRTLEPFLIREACLNGFAELSKWLFKEPRPDRTNTHSFFSQHTGNAAVASFPHGAAFGIAMTVSEGTLRVLSRKHYWWDVVVGGLVGFGCERLSAATWDGGER